MMHTTNQRVIAYILLISHSLMSCYNPDMDIRPRQISQAIQAKKQEVPILDIKEEEQREPSTNPSSVQEVRLEERLPYSTQKKDKLGDTPTSLKAKPFYQQRGEEAPLLIKLARNLPPRQVSHQQALSNNPSIAKREPKQGADFSSKEDKKEDKEDQLTPVFKTQGGTQVQFVKNLPHSLQAKVVDPFGLSYEVPVSYENNIPLALGELVSRGAQEEWSKGNLHLIDLQGAKRLYVGKMGLMGGVRDEDCPYQAKVSEGSSFTEHWNSEQTNRVEFFPSYDGSKRCWKARVRHGSHWLSGGNNSEWSSGWVYSNYSELSEEELRACEKEIIYDCPWYKVGYIDHTKYVLAYLSSSDRSRIQRNKEERHRQEIERMEKKRREEEEAQKTKEAQYAKERDALLETREALVRKCDQLATNNNQTGTFFDRLAQYRKGTLATADKLQEVQQDNLQIARRLSHQEAIVELCKKVQENRLVILSLRAQIDADQQQKKELDQRIDERRAQINEVQKVLEDLKAGRIEFKVSELEEEIKGKLDSTVGGGPWFKVFEDISLRLARSLKDPLAEKIKILEEESKYQSGLQEKVKLLEQAIAQELSKLQQEERYVSQLGQDLNQKLAEEMRRKETLEKLEQQTRKTFEQRKAELRQGLAQVEEVLQKAKQSNEVVKELGQRVSQGWNNNQTISKHFQEVQEQNYGLAQQLSTDAKGLWHQLQETKEYLIYIEEQRNKTRQRQEALSRNTNERQQQIEALSKKLFALRTLYNSAQPIQDDLLNELKTKEILHQEVKALEKVLSQEKGSLQEALEEAQALQEQLNRQVSQATNKKQELTELEKQLEAAFQKKKSQLQNELIQVERELEKLHKNQGNSQSLSEEVSKTWKGNERLVGDLVNKKQQNKESIGRILPDSPSAQDILQEQLKEAQQRLQKISAQKEKAQTQQRAVVTTIQGRKTHIKGLEQQITDLKRQYDTAKKRDKILEEHEQKQKQVEQQIKALADVLRKEEENLEQAQQKATRVQRQLSQEIAQEEAKQKQLKEIEQELQERIREGKALEKEVQQALEQERVGSLADDQKMETLIQQLRQEGEALKDKKAPQHLIDELESLIQQEVTRLQAKNQQKRDQSQRELEEKIVALRDSQAMRKAEARRKVEIVDRLLALKEEAHQAERNKWEAANRQRAAADMKRLAELQKEAAADRAREAKRDQEDAERRRKREARQQGAKKSKHTRENKRNNKNSRYIKPGKSNRTRRPGKSGRSFWNRVGNFFSKVKSFVRRSWSGVARSFKRLGTGIGRGLSHVGRGARWLGRKLWQGVGRLGNQLRRFSRSVWGGVSRFSKRVGRSIWRGLSHVGRGARWLGNQLWQGFKVLIIKNWEGLKEIGKFLWKHKWKILIGAAVVAVCWYVGPAIFSMMSPAQLGGLFGGGGGSLLGGGLMNDASDDDTNRNSSNPQETTRLPQQEIPLVEEGTKEKERKKKEEEDRLKIEEAYKQQMQEEAKKKAEEEQKRKEEQERLKIEEARKQQMEKEAKKKAEEEQKRKEEQERLKVEEARKQQMEEEAKKKAQEELSRKLENILQPIKQERESSIEAESLEDIAAEEKAYDELVKELKSPEFTSQLAQESQQAVKDFLSQEGQATAQAQDLAEGLASQVRQLLSRKQKLDTIAAYTHVGDTLKEIHQELIHVEHNLKATQESLTELCKKYNLPEPDLTPEPPISKEMLKSIFSKVLDTTVPGSELIKILSGLSNSPQNQQEWLQLALDTALDLMPGGKIFKFLKGGVGKLGIKQIESQILKVAARKAKKAVKFSKPKGFEQTKKFGYQHGQKVYEYKGKYYSRDIGSGNGRGSHNGGVWKVFEQRNDKLHRIGTADENLNIFKN